MFFAEVANINTFLWIPSQKRFWVSLTLTLTYPKVFVSDHLAPQSTGWLSVGNLLVPRFLCL